MFANGLDVRKDLLASTIASMYIILHPLSFVFIESLDVIKHYTLPNHSLMSVEAAKRLSVDWMPSMYVFKLT